MGWEPITYCKECGEAFDVYRAPDDRLCDDCKEFLEERECRAAIAWYDVMEEQNERAS
jgi:predicted nucleic acid-binding Zn ribbon protein